MNWGYKLIVVIAVFLIAMLAMVGVAYKQSNEMVESNYYDKEINYQSLINAASNFLKMTIKVKILLWPLSQIALGYL